MTPPAMRTPLHGVGDPRAADGARVAVLLGYRRSSLLRSTKLRSRSPSQRAASSRRHARRYLKRAACGSKEARAYGAHGRSSEVSVSVGVDPE